MSDVHRQVLDLVNEQRQRYGRRPLKPSKRLRLAARAHAREMARRGILAHDIDLPWWRRLYNAVGRRTFRTIGENVARGQDTPAEVVIAWMRSPEHRENILNPDFTHVGLAIAYRGRDEYWAQEFGGR